MPLTLDPRPSTGFTLVEMLVTLALLSLIVLALMAVFNSTQAAFRASLTQTDILESGRNVMGLIVSDLEGMTPSYGSNLLSGASMSVMNGYIYRNDAPPVNFYANPNYKPVGSGFSAFNIYNPPLVQSLTGGTAQRTNILENFFILSRQNVNGSPSWVGAGYVVDPASFPTNTLYRYTMSTNVMNGNPAGLFTNFIYAVMNRSTNYNTFTNTAYWSQLMDGVVELTVRPYDPNGWEMTNTYEYHYNGSPVTFTNLNTSFFQMPLSNPQNAVGFYMFSNTVPASVQVELGVVEDSVLQHVEGLPSAAAQTSYLSNHVGQVHLFRQRVWIHNVDPAAYQ